MSEMQEEYQAKHATKSKRGKFLSNEVYDALKFLALVVLPGLGTLYFALSQIWGFPNGAEVVGTIVAVDGFLGLVLGISTSKYNNSDAAYDGQMDVLTHENGKTFSLQLNSDPEDLESKKSITFKVNPVQD